MAMRDFIERVDKETTPGTFMMSLSTQIYTDGLLNTPAQEEADALLTLRSDMLMACDTITDAERKQVSENFRRRVLGMYNIPIDA